MSREIKFRAWIPKDPYDDRGIDSPDMEMCYDLAFEDYLPINDLLAGVECLMQCTGLKDKNGAEIYEGDIVAVYEHGATEYDLEKASVGAVEWDNEYGRYEHIYPGIATWSRHEVIGNIHENPELLEVGDE